MVEKKPTRIPFRFHCAFSPGGMKYPPRPRSSNESKMKKHIFPFKEMMIMYKRFTLSMILALAAGMVLLSATDAQARRCRNRRHRDNSCCYSSCCGTSNSCCGMTYTSCCQQGATMPGSQQTPGGAMNHPKEAPPAPPAPQTTPPPSPRWPKRRRPRNDRRRVG